MQTAPRKSDLIVQDLLRQIVDGALPVGSILPREADLAEQYGVNRSVVREANKLLEVHGLVQPVRRRGTVVLDPQHSLSPLVLKTMLADADGNVDPKVLDDFLEIRAELDILMVGLAAQRRTEADLVAMEAAIDAAEALRHDPRAYARAVNDFGAAMAAATGNQLFPTLVHWHRAVYDDLEEILRHARQPTAQHTLGQRLLLAGIRNGDPGPVKSLLRQYHGWIRDHLRSILLKDTAA